MKKKVIKGVKTVNIGDKIKDERQKRGYTQKELAERIGVNASVISKYEMNRNRPPLNVLVKIANEVGTPVNYFVDDINGLRDETVNSTFPLLDNPELEAWYLELPYRHTREQLQLLQELSLKIEGWDITEKK
ncbi:XRE family transcriptional regulator [Brochothrix thermosphacta]|uniref:XRE family transcriptional regulator n=1 Tax=Brochothrix thermosphacta TaxID=2756 RepID=A0A291BWE1_BROTH|nr:XRE family transcriptional regulator [Brochothrix thermosphacta]ATH84855.1 XRE family transcriptional regulator [Brochothrix thermosphacta]MPQ28176.1 XRE family transcriptional regulator [Brochothrix thermosphacta]